MTVFKKTNFFRLFWLKNQLIVSLIVLVPKFFFTVFFHDIGLHNTIFTLYEIHKSLQY